MELLELLKYIYIYISSSSLFRWNNDCNDEIKLWRMEKLQGLNVISNRFNFFKKTFYLPINKWKA